MTREEARQLLVARFGEVLAAFPGMPTEYANREQVDLEKQAQLGPFVEFEVEFTDTEQVSFGSPRQDRTLGYVRVIVNAPVGSGISKTNQVADSAISKLSNWQSGSLVTHGAKAEKVGNLPGFVSNALRVFFHFDTYT